MTARANHRVASDRQVLRPFDRREALTTAEAAKIAGRDKRTLLNWADQHGIGRKVVGTVMISRVALSMLLDGDEAALVRYLAGDRHSPNVVAYFERAGLPDVVHQRAA